MGAVCFSSFITPKLTKQYNKSRYVLHELMLEWMSEWSYSLLLVLWWLPHHLEDKVLSSCRTSNTAFHYQTCLLFSGTFHAWGIGALCSSRGELTDNPRTRLSQFLTWYMLLEAVLRLPSSSCWVDEIFGSCGSVLRWRCLSFLSISLILFALSVLVLLHHGASQTIWQRSCGQQDPGLCNRHNKCQSYLLTVY